MLFVIKNEYNNKYLSKKYEFDKNIKNAKLFTEEQAMIIKHMLSSVYEFIPINFEEN